jgi:NAD(P)-dependent dehydrogenase (short-subunit alcohol dehydrogenase family)
LDILVNNAGAFNDGAIESLKTADWDRVLATNLRAPFICTREAFKIMKKQGGGRIINIGSISSQRVRINTAPYCAAKAGLVGLTQSTALEGRPFVINCGCLHPGNVRHDVMPEQTNWSKEAMMTTEEIAAAAVYMACLPPHINVLEMVQMPSQQLFLARG